MSDLLDQENVDDFRAAMRDLTDTFHKTPVTLQRDAVADVDLLAGMVPVETGADGEINGELYAREEQRETVERWILSFNRDYLAELGLIDPDTDQLLIGIDDRIMIDARRFSIVKLTDKGIFRGEPIMVVMTVVR